jgi:adenylate cyclase
MNKPAKALLLGMGTGILGVLCSIVPFTLALEENAGLGWLFSMRGHRTPPADVVIVSIDRESANALGLPSEPSNWPRAQHAALVEVLAAAGASVIVLDIFFREPGDTHDDSTLAMAMRAANRVVLFEYTKKEITRLFDETGNYSGELITQRLVPPVDTLAAAARAVTPFPLPVYPVKVSQYWAFTPGTGDLPTEPVATLQLHAASLYPALLELVAELLPGFTPDSTLSETNDLVRTIQGLRGVFIKNPGLAERMLDALAGDRQRRLTREEQRLLVALIRMYSGPDSRYLNYYGPPQAMTTLPYHQVLRPDKPRRSLPGGIDLSGKVVFVGYSERLHPEQLDEFYTVFSQANGLNLSGVEIAATAFANLLEDMPVSPLPVPAYYTLLLGWGLLAGMLVRLLPAVPAVIAGAGMTGLYLGTAHLLFSHTATWLPLVVPLLLQVPLALFAALLWHYLEVRRERESIRAAFGLYLPPGVVDQLAHDRADGRTQSHLMYGTCMSTDAHAYTPLAEGMEPEALGELMNAYYESLFQPVRKHDGIVSDVVGDAMLALWTSDSPDPDIRRKAILAALEINELLEADGDNTPAHRLPTRIGLHSGQILLGSIGAIDHYEYRAVGDIVNTSTRIQNLNTHLGTRVLLSQEVLAGSGDLISREVGTFILSGKTRPVVIHELLGLRGKTPCVYPGDYLSDFAAGLTAYRQGDRRSARGIFAQLCSEHPADGVARYYLDLCDQPPAPDLDGIIRMQVK